MGKDHKGVGSYSRLRPVVQTPGGYVGQAVLVAGAIAVRAGAAQHAWRGAALARGKGSRIFFDLPRRPKRRVKQAAPLQPCPTVADRNRARRRGQPARRSLPESERRGEVGSTI